MTKYHIAANGEPAVCTAEERACPRGGQHYESYEAALQASFENRMQQVTDGTLKRPLQDKTPVEIDEQLAEIYYRESRVLGEVFMAESRLKDSRERLARAEKQGDNPWNLETYSKNIAYYESKIAELKSQLKAIVAERGPGESEYDFRGRWTRAFLARSKPGHVHRSMNCPSCNKGRQATQFAWLTEYSGKNEDEIVADAGEHACTYCYPSAPVEVLSRASKIKWEEPEAKARREAREAAAAKRAEKGITTPDGGELLLRSRPGSNSVHAVKTLFSAEREAMEAMDSIRRSATSQGISGTDEYRELYAEHLTQLTAAIAHKRGESLEATTTYLQGKFAGWLKRNGW